MMVSLFELCLQIINDLLELIVNYDKIIVEIYNFFFLLGFFQEENKYEDFSVFGFDFENNSMSLMGYVKSNYFVGGIKICSVFCFFFGCVNYNYMMCYMIMVFFCYDGFLCFVKGNKWGFFFFVLLGWNIVNELFWENLKEIVFMFKFCLSYGVLGNQNIGFY